MISAALACIIALIISSALTPAARRLAIKCGVMDLPDERRVHEEPKPRWGGLAIYVAFTAAVIAAAAVDSRVHIEKQLLGVLLGGTVIAVAGLLDDKYNLSPIIQILAMLAGGAILISFGGQIAFVSKPFGEGIQWFKPWLAAIITLVWIVGVTKTIDLMDGLDGLAAGISAIASGTLLIMSAHALANIQKMHVPTAGDDVRVRLFVTVAILSGALLGASLGFLRYNYPPASIFMGTIGAQFMGFVIGASSVVGAFKVATLLAVSVPLMVLAVPLLDTAFVVIKRALRGNKVYEADKSHMHHRLLDRGLSQKQAIWVIYLITAVFSAIGLFFFWTAK